MADSSERPRQYRSPVGDRYGKAPMSAIWAPESRMLRVRDVWIAQAETEKLVGLVTQEEVDDLVTHRDEIDMDVINRRELDRNDPQYTGHDILAAISQYADVAPIGARVLHQADTSEDALSNEEMMGIVLSFSIIENELVTTLEAFAPRILETKDLRCMGWSHDQAAEPTVWGYRLAVYAQDFVTDLRYVRFLRGQLKGKGIKGAVGTSAAQTQLLKDTGMTAREHETLIMERLGLQSVLIAGQSYPRKLALLCVMTLASIGMSAHKFAKDMKTLQSSPFGEVTEPRASGDRSSSSMMHKRNPRHSENIKALSRSLMAKVPEAWLMAADISLERGLEDSAGKRSFLPESFLLTDEILQQTLSIVRGFTIREVAVRRNLEQFAVFTAIEPILTEVCKRGAHRQRMEDVLRPIAAKSIAVVEAGRRNPLRRLVANNPRIREFLAKEEVEALFDSIYDHVGDASERCVEFVEKELYPAIRTS